MTTEAEGIVSELNELIEICEDGAEGYKKAAEDVGDASLKTLFAEYSSQRSNFAEQLRSAVEAHGGNPKDSGHAAGSLHRGWMNIKEMIGNRDKAIIDECEAGEDRAMKAYRDAFDKNIPGIAGDLVNRQFAAIQEAHGKMRNLKHSQN